MKKLFIVFLMLRGCIFFSDLLAQTIVFDTAKVSKENKQIFIPYTIVETPQQAGKHLYNISIRYSQDQGKSYSESLQNVSETGKDVGEYLLPGPKIIVWNYYQENPRFDGQDVWFKLDVKTNLNPFVVGGPENAAYSLLLPGLGNTKVRHYPKYWYLNTVATFSLIGTGIVLNSQSNKTYDKYLNAQTFEDTQKFYDRSNNQRRTGRLLMLGGAAIWATDIIRVALKGRKNIREQKKLIEKYPHIKEKFSLHYNLDYDYWYQQPSFSVGLKF
ncbi:MAG: hypothetical protein NW226_26600 [Microscillaceae bacterium]|nr:hypothetical protein [Microscillaceae bacterium]